MKKLQSLSKEELINKKLQLLHRHTSCLESSPAFKEAREEAVVLLKRLFTLEKQIIQKKGGKLNKKEELLDRYVDLLNSKVDFISETKELLSFK